MSERGRYIDLMVKFCIGIRPIWGIPGEWLIGRYRAGYFANIIPHLMSAFANSGHGTSLDGMILHEWRRKISWGENKCPELATNGGAGNKRPTAQMKTVKTFPECIQTPTARNCLSLFF